MMKEEAENTNAAPSINVVYNWFEELKQRVPTELNGLTVTGLQLFAGNGSGNEGLVSQTGASWNRVALWLRQLESLRRAS